MRHAVETSGVAVFCVLLPMGSTLLGCGAGSQQDTTSPTSTSTLTSSSELTSPRSTTTVTPSTGTHKSGSSQAPTTVSSTSIHSGGGSSTSSSSRRRRTQTSAEPSSTSSSQATTAMTTASSTQHHSTSTSPSTASPLSGACASSRRPKDSRCSGCPPTFEGRLCASTSTYHDQTKGPCGCAEQEPPPSDWWTLSNFTAAMNAKSLDSANPLLTWCPSGCGGCFELCSTGGYTDGIAVKIKPRECRVFRVTNRCGDGYDPTHVYPEWCSQHLTWQECQTSPTSCQKEGSTNKFGYPAHFDLMNLHNQIHNMGWGSNSEVTFEPVSCARFDGPVWDCQCPAETDAVTI